MTMGDGILVAGCEFPESPTWLTSTAFSCAPSSGTDYFQALLSWPFLFGDAPTGTEMAAKTCRQNLDGERKRQD